MSGTRALIGGVLSIALFGFAASCTSDVAAPRSLRSATGGAGAGALAAGGGSAVPLPAPPSPNPVASTTTDVRPVGAAQCAAISQTAQNRLQPADVVWAIDNSGSMREEMQFVRENMNAFSRQIAQSGIDVHIVMLSDTLAAPDTGMAGASGGMGNGGRRGNNGICIDAPLGSGNCPEDTKLPAYLHVPQRVDSHNALDVIVSSYAQWMAQLRPGATKSFVVVTDDDAIDRGSDLLGLLGIPAMVPTVAERSDAFIASVKALDPQLFAAFQFDAIYSFTMCPDAAAIGQTYTELVNRTGGLRGDLCQQDFKPVFDQLAQGIAAASQIDCEWAIPAPPAGTSFEVGKVNVQYTSAATPAPQTVVHVTAADACPAQGGWFYDDAARPSRVMVCPATCDTIKRETGTKVDILFGCATIVPQ